MPNQKAINGEDRIKHFYSEDWFGEDGQREIYLRYYSMPIPPRDDFYIPGLDQKEVMFSGVPFRVAVARISGQDYKTHIPWLINFESGQSEIYVEEVQRILPDANYILVSTPINNAGDQAYKNASEIMDGFVGMLRLVGGNNLLRQLVREASVDISSGDMKTFSEPVPVPQEIDGPFATEGSWQQFKQVADAIADTDGSEGRRLTLATQLIERAFSSRDAFKFFSYWVALEVAADTHSTGKIITLLAKAYGQSRSYIQNDLGFQHLRETRQAVFHNGEYYDAPSDVERYIQWLFLDVVRAKLGLDCKGYMAAMVGAGFDVGRLDRTVVQSEILTIDPA